VARTGLILCALLLALPVAAAAKTPPALTGYGATRAVFDAHHRRDPKGKGYLPRLKSGRDAVQAVFQGGVALHVVVAFAPAVRDTAALRAAAKLLPPDARRLRVVRQPGCEQVVYASLAFARRFQSAIWVELKSAGRFARGAVVSATLDASAADSAIPC
jgi:hypothetical protein